MMLGRPQAALEHLQSAVRLQPDDADAHNNLAAALVSLGRTSEAVEHLREAVRLKPTYIQAWNNLAAAYDELHRSEEAVAAAEKVLTLARSQGNSALAQQMEDWLAAHLRTVFEVTRVSTVRHVQFGAAIRCEIIRGR